jgi:hypothetical protein
LRTTVDDEVVAVPKQHGAETGTMTTTC